MTWCGVSVGEVQGRGMWFEEVPALWVGTRHGAIIKLLIFLGFEEVVGGGVAEGVGVGGTEGLRGVGVGGTEGLRGVGMLDAELHSSAQSATELVCIFFCFLASLALFFFSAIQSIHRKNSKPFWAYMFSNIIHSVHSINRFHSWADEKKS